MYATSGGIRPLTGDEYTMACPSHIARELTLILYAPRDLLQWPHPVASSLVTGVTLIDNQMVTASLVQWGRPILPGFPCAMAWTHERTISNGQTTTSSETSLCLSEYVRKRSMF